MPIIFISINESFTKKIRECGFEAFTMNIQDYEPTKKTYYVSPANSLCFMDGGIDYALSRLVFPNVEPHVKNIVKSLNVKNLLGRYYLPIGSSIIVNNGIKSLVVAPTMLLPQDVSNTKNAYYATMAVLYNVLINKKEDINNVDIIFTSMCCGFGKMSEDESIKQMIQGIKEYKYYSPTIINEDIIIHEPNLLSQPKIYQNTEWFSINSHENKVI